MLLIADSGSTKCDWALVEGDRIVMECSTMGFNPYFHSASFILSKLQENSPLSEAAAQVTRVYFYGAGCSSQSLDKVVEEALSQFFSHASVVVDHDLLAAAYATWDGQPAISCILGTGSNSCFFDGDSLYEEVPALAYILGDEGSGSYYGKKLIAAWFYKRLPSHIHDRFKEQFDLTMEDVVEHVYTRPHANVYLASFMKFFSQFREDPWVKEMILEGMKAFLDVHVCSFPNYRTVKTHFVGSVATYFEDRLREAAAELGVNVGQVIKKPIHGLVKFHLQRDRVRV
jgi:N-acetylglucosamine kinase-like BadF-type ATPase